MKFTKLALASTAAIGLTAGMASAQEFSCGGIGADGQWIGGTAEASDIASSQGPLVMGNVPIADNGNATLFFTLSATGQVRLEAQQTTEFGDPLIELYDESGTIIVSDDDSGGALASRAELELATGNYCLLTRGFAGRGLSADIQVGRLEHEEITQGLAGGFFGGADPFSDPFFVGIDPCTPETEATALGTGSLDSILFNGGIAASNTIAGVPYYRFTLDAPQAVSIRAENQNADPYIYIFDGQGTLLAENDDYESLNSRVDFTTPLPAGDYCIGMRSLSDPNLPVTVSIMGYDEAAALNDLYAAGNAAPPMDGSFPITDMGVLPGRTVRDVRVSGQEAAWFSFEVTQRGAIVIDAVEVTNSDPILILYDDLGNEIAYNDDANGSLNSQLVARVQAGRYMLALRQYSESYDGIIRLATESFVPAP